VTIEYNDPFFISIFLQMMAMELNYSNGGKLKEKTFTHWQMDDSNQTTVFKQWHLNHYNQIKLPD